MTKTFLPQNQFISGSASVPFAKPEATSLIAPHEVVTLSDGVGAKPILAPSEAATVSGREPVAATFISDGKDVPARMQGSNDCGLARDDVKPGVTMQESRPAHPATAPSGLTHNAVTQAVEIQSSCGSFGSLPDTLNSVVQLRAASLDMPGPQDHIHELERLIGVAGKRRRRPLNLPRFAPDFPELWKAMHDKSAPRAVLDPLWADASPLFLRGSL